MRLSPPLFALLLAAACTMPPGLDHLDSGAAEQGLAVSTIEPAWGSPGGGTEVTILGAGFMGDVQVSFGNAVVTPTVVDETTLTVVTPAANIETVVDVTVESTLGTVVVEDGFSFSASGPPRGEVAGLVQFTLVQWACPGCYSPTLTTDYQVSATAGFHQPVDASWVGWFPELGTCVSNPVSQQPTEVFDDVGEWVYLSSGSVSISMRRVQEGRTITYESLNLDNNDFLRTAMYDLAVPSGGESGPFEIEDALQTPEGLSSISPIELLYTDPRTAFADVVDSRRGITIGWSPYGSNGSFIVQMVIYTAAGQLQGQVLCRQWDNGSLTIDGSYYSAYAPGSLIEVYLNRYEIGTATNPVDGTVIESVSSIGAIGTASIARP